MKEVYHRPKISEAGKLDESHICGQRKRIRLGKINEESEYPDITIAEKHVSEHTKYMANELDRLGVSVEKPFRTTSEKKGRFSTIFNRFKRYDSSILKKEFFYGRGKTMRESTGLIPEEKKMEVVENLLEQIRKMHENNYTHGDLHEDNILIDTKTLKIMLIDLEYTIQTKRKEELVKRIILDLIAVKRMLEIQFKISSFDLKLAIQKTVSVYNNLSKEEKQIVLSNFSSQKKL